MGSPRIPFEPGAHYHIYNHAVGNEDIFREEENYLFYFVISIYYIFIPFSFTFIICSILISFSFLKMIHFLLFKRNPLLFFERNLFVN